MLHYMEPAFPQPSDTESKYSGLTKLEYFALEIYRAKLSTRTHENTDKNELYNECIMEAQGFLNKLSTFKK